MKKILMVLIIMLSIFIPTKIYALEDSFYEGEYITNTYMKKFKDGSGKYQQMKVFRRKSDNRPVYCIELWEALSNGKIIIGYDTNQNKYANIDYSVWEKIVLLAYYGYGYKDHTDIKWYAITQFMIWQVTSPDSNIYFTDTLNGKKIDKYEDEMNEINTLIEMHNIRPSFNRETHEINYKENFTITDTNNVLERFVVNDPDRLTVTKSNNQLTVKSKYVKNSTVILINKGKQYDNNPTVYIDDDGQDVLLPGNYNPIYSGVNFNVPISNITVNKFDIETTNSQGSGKFEGTKFQLLDVNKKIIQEKIIDNDGKLVFENVGYGNYYLKEVEAGEGYLLNNEVISLKVDEETETIDFYNQVMKNKISFQKYIKNPLTGITEKESNVKFSIYNDSEKIITFENDENGYYELELPYGTYTIKQETGTKNHYFIDDFEINVLDDGKIQNFELYSEEIIANIKIVNTDFDSNLPLLEKGATFEIKNIDTQESFILETNDLGVTDLITLSSGDYQIKQLTQVNDYFLNEEVYPFSINIEVEFDKNEFGNNLEISIPNKKQKSQIEIEKYIETYLNDSLISKEKDNDIKVPIYAKEDIYSKDGVKIYTKDEQVNVAVLNNEKVISDLLELGNYYIQNITDDSIIDIKLNSLENIKIELVMKVYEYEKVEDEEEIITEPVDKIPELKPDNSLIIGSVSNTIIKNETTDNVVTDVVSEEDNAEIIIEELPEVNNEYEEIIEVPNTLIKESILVNINYLFMTLGLILIGIGKLNENN